MKETFYNIILKGKYRYFLPIFIAVQLMSGQDILAQNNSNDAEFCSKLQALVNSASKSSFGDNKREGIGANIFSVKTFLVSSDAKIYYDDKIKSDIYEERIVTFSDSIQDNAQRDIITNNALQKIVACLPNEQWLVQRAGDNTYVVKNSGLGINIDLKYQNDGIILKMNKQPTTVAKCLSGDCVNGFGTMQYENGDVYEGQFLNSQRIGMGKYTWASDKSRYEGSWLADTMSGYGTYHNSEGALEKEGYLLKGSSITVDTTNKNFCQYGNCKNGFGMYYYAGGQVYIGNFKNGLQHGLGLFESENGIYYGEFLNGKYEGKGIIFGTDGTVFRAEFLEGKQIGEMKAGKPGETVKEAVLTDTALIGAEYTPEGILLRIGAWQGDKFIPSTSKDDKILLEFAESLAKLYSYRDQKYGRLRGNLRKGKKVVYYDAIFKLKDAAATFVREELNKEPYVRANMTLQPLPKDQALAKYEWAVRNVRKSLSKTWKGDAGDVRDTETTINRNYTFVNMDNKESFIDVRVVDNLVYIDIH